MTSPFASSLKDCVISGHHSLETLLASASMTVRPSRLYSSKAAARCATAVIEMVRKSVVVVLNLLFQDSSIPSISLFMEQARWTVHHRSEQVMYWYLRIIDANL